jgi:hypothetical protein
VYAQRCFKKRTSRFFGPVPKNDAGLKLLKNPPKGLFPLLLKFASWVLALVEGRFFTRTVLENRWCWIFAEGPIAHTRQDGTARAMR